MRGFLWLSAVPLAVFVTACGSDSPPPARPQAVAAPIRDRTSMMPLAGRLSTRTVPNHLLDLPELPGGTLGDYEAAGKKYQMFIIEAESNQKAALLLLSCKGAMNNPAYIPYMGGYSGTLGDRPAFIFAKLQYLAGVVGLSRELADPIARQLAARLR